MSQHLSSEQLARYRNRQSTPEELGLLDEHLAGCADCRERLFSAGRVRDALQGGSLVGQPAEEEHLSYEQLEAFVDEESSRAETQRVQAHVAACRLCAEELQDLRTFKTELTHTDPVLAQTQKGWRAVRVAPWFRARPVFVAAASAAVLVLTVLEINSLRTPRSPQAPQIAGSHSTTSLSASPAVQSLPVEEQRDVLNAFARWGNAVPDSLSGLQGKNQTLLGESKHPSALELLQPVGEVVRAERPLFRWNPLSHATYYSVSVFDTTLNPVESSGKLQNPQWTPARSLKRGQVYQWQVTAHLEDGSSINAPAPPQPEAKFRVLDQQKEEDLSRFAAAHAAAHLPLGILEGEMGLLSEAEQEFQQVAKNDSDYPLAQNLIKRIQGLRRSGN
jgi:hypothetical protein